MTSKDISILCNYQESSTPINPSSKLMYIDMKTDMDESYLREIKKKNRGLAIDAILEDKVEEYNNRQKTNNWPPDIESESPFGSGYTPTISPTVYSIGLSNPYKFQSHEDIWDRLILMFESNTKTPHSFLATNGISQLSYQKDNTISEFENSQKFSRKLLTRVMSISSMIAASLSRIGPATFIIIGTDVLPIISGLMGSFNSSPIIENKDIIGSLSGITVIVSNKIQSNKVIVGRAETNQDAGGLIVMNDMNRYYILETPHTFYKKVAWFEII